MISENYIYKDKYIQGEIYSKTNKLLKKIIGGECFFLEKFMYKPLVWSRYYYNTIGRLEL